MFVVFWMNFGVVEFFVLLGIWVNFFDVVIILDLYVEFVFVRSFLKL